MNYYLLEADGGNRPEQEKEMAAYLGLEASDLDFQVVSEKKGLIGLFKSSKSELFAYPAHDNIPIEAHARGVVTTMLEKLEIDAEIQRIYEHDSNLMVELSSPDTGYIIGKHGRTLDALQFLVNLVVHHHCKNNQRIMLDVDGYRDRREKSLKDLASRMAEKVSRSGRSILLNYMNPYERRIVHLFLESDDRVTTESDGNGVYKRLRIISTKPKKKRANNRGRGRDREPDEQIDTDADMDSVDHGDQVLADESYDYGNEELYDEQPDYNEKIVEGHE
ncbi:MAG: KH domain-containing protein [Leptospiraceae bacterium]|nr:KH domain-containing protein [Leptospiraceae bacterium]